MRYLHATLLFLFLVPTLFFIPMQLSAFSVEDVITQNSKDMWHVGKGLSPGDSFVYAVCDNMQRFIQYGNHCFNIRFDFFGELVSKNDDVWVVQVEIQNDNSTRHHIFLIDSDTLDITTDSAGSEFADSVEDTIFYLVKFANETFPKHLIVGSTWGSTVSSFNQNSNIIVSSKESIIVSNLDIIDDAYSVRYGIFEPNIFMISQDMPFPIYAAVYDPLRTNVDPRISFTFELQDYSLGGIYTTRGNSSDYAGLKIPKK